METNKVYVEDWGSDSLVPIFTLSLSERADLNPYVEVGGVKRPISEIDKFLENKAEKAAVYKYMDSKPHLKERSYQNIAQARWEMGNLGKVEKTAAKMREGSIKHVDGSFVSRGTLIDMLSRLPIKSLKSDKYRADVKKLYGDEGVRLVDYVATGKVPKEKKQRTHPKYK